MDKRPGNGQIERDTKRLKQTASPLSFHIVEDMVAANNWDQAKKELETLIAEQTTECQVRARHLLARLLVFTAHDSTGLEEAMAYLEAAVQAGQQASSLAEVDTATVALRDLCMLLYQSTPPSNTATDEDTDNEELPEAAADELVLASGYRYRLATAVLRYQTTPSQLEVKGSEAFVQAVDNCFSSPHLEYLTTAFAADSSFWAQHDYSILPPSPYFSYVHSLSGCGSAASGSSKLDAVIEHVRRVAVEHFPAVKEARFAEWWAHCRPHASGHQLHFDTDNEGLQGLHHPIVSCVVYLTDGVGGPTLVTDQESSSKTLAERGWLVLPKRNRLVMFKGSVLHGVIPGRGYVQDPTNRRISFMIAFWDRMTSRPSPTPSAARPFPAPTGLQTSSWVQQHYGPLPDSTGSAPTPVAPLVLPDVWHNIPKAMGMQESGSSMPSYDECFQGF